MKWNEFGKLDWTFNDLKFILFKITADVKENDSTRMDTDKFAKLCIIGIANKLDEVWISPLTEMLAAYGVQYMPTLTYWYEYYHRIYMFNIWFNVIAILCNYCNNIF